MDTVRDNLPALSEFFDEDRLNIFVGKLYNITIDVLSQNTHYFKRINKPDAVEESEGVDYWQSVDTNDNIKTFFAEKDVMVVVLEIDMLNGSTPESNESQRRRIMDIVQIIMRKGLSAYEQIFYQAYQSPINDFLRPNYYPVRGTIDTSLYIDKEQANVEIKIRLVFN